MAWQAFQSLYDDFTFAAGTDYHCISFKVLLSFLPIHALVHVTNPHLSLVHVTNPHLSLHTTADVAEESRQSDLTCIPSISGQSYPGFL